MNQFEKPPGWTEMPETQSGDRRKDESEGGAKFDASYDAMLVELRTKGDPALADFTMALPQETKEKLAEALMLNNRDWIFLARLGKENSAAVMAHITDWGNAIKGVTDMRVRDKINGALIDFLYRLD